MKTKPGEVYQVDFGIKGKVRPVVIVSREDADAPRAMAVCAPLTTAARGGAYEVNVGKPRFLREISFVNVQGLVAVEQNDLRGPVGRLGSDAIREIKEALRFLFDL